MSSDTTLTTLDYALLAAASNETAHPAPNRLSAPDGWTQLHGNLSGLNTTFSGDLGHCENKGSGFEAAAYQHGNHIVISYAGTNPTDLREWFTDLEIGMVGTANQQIKDAAAYYQEIRAAHPDAEITFTGHSLGGGLAALMGAFFNREAVTFDPAPFRLAATAKVAGIVADYLKTTGYHTDADLATYHTTEQPLASIGKLAGILLGLDFIGDNLYPTTIRGEENVRAIVLNGEFLTNGMDAGLGLVTASMNALRIMNQLTVLDTNDHGAGLNLGDYHAINLLTLALAAPELTEAAKTIPNIFTAMMKDDAAYGSHEHRASFIVHLLNTALHHGNHAYLAAFTQEFTDLSHYIQNHTNNSLVHNHQWQRAVTDIVIDHYMHHDSVPAPALQFQDNVLHFHTAADSPTDFLQHYMDHTAVLSSGGREIHNYLTEGHEHTWLSALNDDTAQLQGQAAQENILIGRGGDDVLHGGEYSDVLIGAAGNDILNGGKGADLMAGGTGNDIYYVDNAGDQIFESAGQGTDTVIANISYRLTNPNLENLILDGHADLNAIGNAQDNLLIGNDGNNILYGGMGNDTLSGGAGNDLLMGGLGSDHYLFGRGDGHDTVDDQGSFAERNTVTFTGDIRLADLQMHLDSAGLHIHLKGDNADSLCIAHWTNNIFNNPITQFNFSDGSHIDAYSVHLLLDQHALPTIA